MTDKQNDETDCSSGPDQSLEQFLRAAHELPEIAQAARELGEDQFEKILIEQGVPVSIHEAVKSYNRGIIDTRELQAKFFRVFLAAFQAPKGAH